MQCRHTAQLHHPSHLLIVSFLEFTQDITPPGGGLGFPARCPAPPSPTSVSHYVEFLFTHVQCLCPRVAYSIESSGLQFCPFCCTCPAFLPFCGRVTVSFTPVSLLHHYVPNRCLLYRVLFLCQSQSGTVEWWVPSCALLSFSLYKQCLSC